MSAFIMSSTVDQGLCDSAREFIAACAGNIEDAPEASQYKLSYERFKADKIKSSDDDYLRWLLADTNELVVHLYKMEEIVKGLNQTEVRNRLRSCPSSIEGNNGKADSDMDLCGKALGEIKGLIKAEGKNAEKLKEVLEKREKAATSLESVAGKANPIVPPKNSSENIR